MTAAPDDGYPDQWKPSFIRKRDEQRTEIELLAAAMSDDEWTDFSHRVRGGDR